MLQLLLYTIVAGTFVAAVAATVGVRLIIVAIVDLALLLLLLFPFLLPLFDLVRITVLVCVLVLLAAV